MCICLSNGVHNARYYERRSIKFLFEVGEGIVIFFKIYVWLSSEESDVVSNLTERLNFIFDHALPVHSWIYKSLRYYINTLIHWWITGNIFFRGTTFKD